MTREEAARVATNAQIMGESCSELSTPAGMVQAGCRRGQGCLAGAERQHCSSQLSTTASESCASLGAFDN